MNSIHGHNILNWLGESSAPLSYDELAARTAEHFGGDARFKTCNSDGHTLAELLVVLEQRGKVTKENGGYRAVAGTVCDNR